MHRFTAVLVCVLALSLASLHASPAEAQTAELQDAIYTYFDPGEYGTAEAIVACESGYGADILNEGSGAFGAWQFLPSTSYGMGFDHAAMYDPYYSTWAASVLQDEAGWSPWACAYRSGTARLASGRGDPAPETARRVHPSARRTGGSGEGGMLHFGPRFGYGGEDPCKTRPARSGCSWPTTTRCSARAWQRSWPPTRAWRS